MERKPGYYWVKYVSRSDWSIEYWNGGMWFTRNPHLVDDNMFSTIDETPIVRGQNSSEENSALPIPDVSVPVCHICDTPYYYNNINRRFEKECDC